MTDPSHPSAKQGDILNWQELTDVQNNQVADSVVITKGTLVYQDTTNGLKVVPTSSQPQGKLVRFAVQGADNTVTGHTKGFFSVETVKQGARVVGKCEGVIPVGSRVRASLNTAGSFAALAPPIDATLAATVAGTAANTDINAVRDYAEFDIGFYVGHPGEGDQIGKEPTDGADGDLGVFVLQ